MLRKRLVGLPKWDQVLSKWTWKQSYKHAWRTRPLYDVDDLYAEGYCRWRHIVDFYPRIRDQRHLMGLYKSSFTNLVTDIAKRRPRHPLGFTEVFPEFELASFIEDRGAPALITNVDKKLDRESWTEKARMILEAFQGSKTPIRRAGEGINDFLCRITGFDPEVVDLEEVLESVVLTPTSS